MDIYEQITKMADEIAPELVAQRRDFHKFAEKGWFEMRTSSIIARKPGRSKRVPDTPSSVKWVGFGSPFRRA